MLSIRPARPDDAALVMELIRDLARYEKLLDDVDADENMIADALFAPQPRVFCDIAEWTDPGAPAVGAGFALWFYNFSTFRGRHGIYLEDLYVEPAFRGHGIGKALLVHLAKRCVAEGLPRLQWSVLHWNTPSIEFYKSQGAVELADWRGYRVSEDALKRLADSGG